MTPTKLLSQTPGTRIGYAICAGCLTSFRSRRSNTLTCGDVCRQRLSRWFLYAKREAKARSVTGKDVGPFIRAYVGHRQKEIADLAAVKLEPTRLTRTSVKVESRK